MEKLKDAAMLLKAKLTKDQTEELLIQATSEENWQTPTPILHDICNVAYNYEQWQKIQSFIWEKLKLKRWRKVLKTLNMVEFLLKNGPSSTISSFKHEIYVFRSLDNFNSLDEGVDRGEAIRERAKAIVQLLSNEQLLEEERTKAKTIKQRMGESSGSGSTYKGSGSKSFNYSGNSGSSKYEGYDNKGKGKGGSSGYGSGGSSGDYNSGYSNNNGSNLNKYKKDLGGESAYKKGVEDNKKQEVNKNNKIVEVQQQTQVEEKKTVVPKPFDQQGRKLQKPGEVKIDLNKKIPPAVNKPSQQPKQPAQQPATTGSGFDFFGEEEPAKPVVQNVTPVAQTNQSNSLPFGQFTLPQQPQQPPQQLYQPPQQPQQPQQPPQQLFQQQQQPQQQQLNFGNQGSLNIFGNQPTQQQQIPNNLNFNFNPQPNFQQNSHQQAPAANTNQGLLGFGNISMNPKPVNNITFNGPSSTNDEFGGFDTGNKEIKWMSADESNLTNLTDLSKQVNEKNITGSKKKGNEGNLLATSEDFDFMAAPSTNYNLGMNFGGNQTGNVMIGGYPGQNANFNFHGQQNQNQLGGITFF